MDYFKFKLAFGRHPPKSRFESYDLNGDLADHELIGILPNSVDLSLGTPNLNRAENITLLLSNSSSKDTILLELKWRPVETGQVALVSRLKMVLADTLHEFTQTEIYKPVKSPLRPDYIMQYGSRGSTLKLFIAAPYRKMRLVFRDHVSGNKFVKLNLIISATAPIYDFLTSYNPECFKNLYEEKRPKRSIEQTMTELLFSDRHEHPVRADGEYMIQDGDTKVRNKLIVWGFHAKQFISNRTSEISLVKSRRILGHLINGQLFHIGNSSLGEDNMDFGYTFLNFKSGLVPIDKPFFSNWDRVNEKAGDFELEVSGEGKTFDCKAQRRWPEIDQFFDIQMNGKQGWAWVENKDSIVDSSEELDRLQQLVTEHRKLLDEGHLVEPTSLTLNDQPATLIVSIAEPQCTQSDLVGSKASSLAQLHQFSGRKLLDGGNFIVPHAFVLTKYAYDAILSADTELQEAMSNLERMISESQLDSLLKECERVQAAIESSTLIESVQLELESKLRSHYGDKLDGTLFAVRSSSWGEDEEDMSAAGQLRTILGVRGLDAIMKAVMACFASKYTYANIEYKRQHGLGPNLPMAVVVQEMIACEKAGVLFTCDVTSGNQRALTITANYGLGESVVSGQSDPDSILIRVKSDDANQRELLVKEVKVGEKKVIIDSDSLLRDEHNQQETTQYDRSVRCISHDETLKLAECGLALAKYYQHPCDIEWGYKGDQLFLFQSRPITSLDAFTEHELLHEADLSTSAEWDYYTRANIGEVIPYAIKPMTLTSSMQLWNVLGGRMIQKLEPKPGRVYWPGGHYEILFMSYHNLFKMQGSSMFPIVDPNQEKPLLIRAMEISFFGHEIDPQPGLIEASKGLTQQLNVFQGPKFDLYAMSLKLMPNTVIMREKVVAGNLRNSIRNLKFAQGYEVNKMMGLLKQIRTLARFCQTPWENHITIIMLIQANNVSLTSVLAKYIKDPVQLFTAMSKILAHSPNVISAEIPQRIDSMARLIRSQGPEAVEGFLKLTDSEAVEYVRDGSICEQLAKEFDLFIDRFGHRCYNEFELSESSWREKPSLIVEMLRQNCTSPKADGGDTKPESMSMDRIIDSLNLGPTLSLKDRALLKYVIGPRSQNLVASRERTKDILIEQADLVREATRMLAKEMRRQLRIPDEDLYYFLMYHELEPLIREPQPAVVVQAIRRRQMFQRIFTEPWKFDEIIKGPDLVPNHLKPSKELDAALANAPKLYGTPASCGRAQARVCLVLSYNELAKVRRGDILVAHSTDIGFSPVFPLLAGIITEVGGLISHGAVVAREYGLPSVLGIPDVTRILTDGEEIILDADNGVIMRLNR